MTARFDFQGLTPDTAIDVVEEALDERLMGLAEPLTSYINRVYQLLAAEGHHVIAKFYRPGRWTRDALEEEHTFVADCAADEIPVVSPMEFPSGGTLAEYDGIYFAVYPRRWGRQLEINDDDSYRRLGQLLGRVHAAGQRGDAEHRVVLHPEQSTAADIAFIRDGDFVTPGSEAGFNDVTDRLLDTIHGMFDDCAMSRIHGDLHGANLLERPDEGLMMIDFDDMAIGPPVQDLWMLLPDHAHNARTEINLILEGYEDFLEFDDYTLRLIEPLRAMRMLYFLAWCAKQRHDPDFQSNFEDWGSDRFWYNETMALERQLQVIQSH